MEMNTEKQLWGVKRPLRELRDMCNAAAGRRRSGAVVVFIVKHVAEDSVKTLAEELRKTIGLMLAARLVEMFLAVNL